jgi:amino acid adenylation domain-containing protein/non-ribosomal peptide synthase protein (TIGR01720 family)
MFAKKNVKNIYALTPMQEAMLFYALYDESSSAHFEQSYYHVTGRLNVQSFEAAWNQLADRHDVLRTLFVHKNVPQPLQIVLKKRNIDFHFEDLRGRSPEDQEARCRDYRDKDIQKPFDLSKDVLMRLAVFQLDENSFNCVWSFHHILMDGWSGGILWQEFQQIYKAHVKGESPKLDPAPAFSAFVKWLKAQDRAAAGEYWRGYLEGYQQTASVPGFVSEKTYDPKTFQFEFDAELSHSLRGLAAENRVTINTVVQALWGILLATYNKADDVVFGATVSGRPPQVKGIEKMVGLFINVIPTRIRAEAHKPLSDLLREVHRESLNAKDWHHSSLAEIQAETPLKRNLLDHILVFENYPVETALKQSQDSPEEEFVIDRFEHFDHTNYDLSIQVTPEEKIHFHLIYNASVYDDPVIRNIEPHLKKIAAAAVQDPGAEIGQIEVLTDKEKDEYRIRQEKIAQSHQASDQSSTGERKNDEPYAPPEDDQQKKLAEIWEQILKISNIGIDDHYIALGGHSIAATRIVSAIHKAFNVEIGLKEFFEYPTIRGLSELIRRKDFTRYAPIEKVPEQPHYALSHSQKRLWLLDRLEDNFIAYNLSGGFLFRARSQAELGNEKKFHPEAFRRAFKAVMNRHESLRTTFLTADGEPRQTIRQDTGFEIESVQLSTDNSESLKAYAVQQATLPFDLEKGPLLRVQLLELPEDCYLCLIHIHHIISDGWSMGILSRELLELYRGFSEGKTPQLPELPIQYRDYAAWHNQLLDDETIREHREYWHQKLSGELPVLDLPADFPRPPVQSYRGALFTLELDETITRGLREISADHRVSLFMTLTAAVKVLLHRYTGQEDIILGVPIAGRNHPDLEDQIGFYVNTLALRDQITGDESFADILSKVRQTAAAAYEHQIYPFDKLVEELNVSRDVSRSPIFDVMLVLQNPEQTEWNIGELDISEFEYDPGISQFDLTFNFAETGKTLWLGINYNLMFREETIRRMGAHLTELAKNLPANSDMSVSRLNILEQAERHRILVGFNDGKSAYPKDKTITDLFQEQVQKTPDNIAVIFGDQILTYKELDEQAERLASHLKKQYDIQPDDIVGVIAERNQDLIISLLGIMKAGGAYLPIDPAYPQQRIDYMIKDSGCKAVLNCGSEVAANTQHSILNTQHPTHNLAYVIYTSGSTGEPKGVMIEHGGFVNMILAQIEGFGVEDSDRVLQFASPSFDASLSEIFMALLRGAGLVMIAKETIEDTGEFLRYIEDKQVSVITFPPVYLNMLNKHPLPTVKTIITAGEPAILSDAEFYCKTKAYFNAYGPTETSVCTSFCKVSAEILDASRETSVPIGRPIANSSVYIVDDAMNPVPVGVPGEICFSGPGVARGYLNKPELTAEKFIDNPFKPGERLYKIGDLGQWLPDGNIRFLGRKDDQVKIRGYRIELGEIKKKLTEHPAIEDALVMAMESAGNAKELAAYLITNAMPDIPELRQFLGQGLPEFMIPKYFIALEKFPLTVNGKIDKRALPDPARISESEAAPEYVAPRNETEDRIAKIWQEMFGKKQIGIHEDFFSMGGDSVRAIQMSSRFSEANLPLKARDMFQYPTIARLAEIADARCSESAIAAVPDTVPPVGEVPLTAISRWFFKEFSADPHHFCHCAIFHARQGFDEAALRAAFSKIHEHHDILRSVFLMPDAEKPPVHRITDSEYPLWFETADLSAPDSDNSVTAYAEGMARRINLEKGTMMKAALIRSQDGDRFLIMGHHLVLDRVSWNILMEDLSRAYTLSISGEPISLPQKTDAFRTWAMGIQKFSTSHALLREKPYWQSVEDLQVPDLPFDYPSQNGRMRDIQGIQLSLSRDETDALLGKAVRIYGAAGEEILLAALAKTLSQWHGHSETLINLEGHGREDIIPGADVSRTVGWFTSVCPVMLASPVSPDPGEWIDAVKKTVRVIPNRGIGYGILKYVTPPEYKKDMVFRLRPRINFNYLGQYAGEKIGGFEVSEESPGYSVSPNAKLIHDLDFTLITENGQLHVYLAFNNKRYRRETVEGIMESYRNQLSAIRINC